MVMTFDEKGSRVHTCAKCRFSARNTSNLRSHIEANHMQGRAYTCGLCGEEKKTWQPIPLSWLRRRKSVTDWPLAFLLLMCKFRK